MKHPKRESEIIESWNGHVDRPLVSIFCIAYNHERYIEDALRGFLIQETDFPFEILIHDDASTDRTASIIREYESRYPSIVKPVYQKENQYSKGVRINATFNLPRAKGEYIALCEGDDYWTDPTKLQNQAALMGRYPEINISFHAARRIHVLGLRPERIVGDFGDEVKIFSPRQVILGGGGFMATASLIVRRSIFGSARIAAWRKISPVGDFLLQVEAAIPNGALYMPVTAAVYRRGDAGSWTTKTNLKLSTRLEQQEIMSRLYRVMAESLPDYQYEFRLLTRKSNFRFVKVAIYKRDLRAALKGFVLWVKYYRG